MEHVNKNLRKKFSKRLGMKKIISNILAVVCICSLISYCFFRFSSKEIDELKEYISRIEQELKSSQEQNTLLQNDILALQVELGRLREELTSLNGELAEQREYINELQEKVALLEARVENLISEKPEFVKFPETAPMYTRNENYVELFNLEKEGDPFAPFEEYFEYCQNNFSDLNFVLLTCINNEYNLHPLMYRKYSVLCESIENGIPKNVMFYQRFNMYSEVAGDKHHYWGNWGEGYMAESIDLEILIKPISKKVHINSINLYFGELKEDVRLKKYVNLYSLGECFATCFYKDLGHISINWFTEYFENYFVYI